MKCTEGRAHYQRTGDDAIGQSYVLQKRDLYSMTGGLGVNGIEFRTSGKARGKADLKHRMDKRSLAV